MDTRSFSSSHASCDMFVGFSFGVTVHGFGGTFVTTFAAFARSFLFSGSEGFFGLNP
jgi:hypothetical protein